MIEKPIHHEVVPGEGWVAPDHPLHPDYDEVVKKPLILRERIAGMIRLHDPELAEDETALSVLVHQILIVFRKEIERAGNPYRVYHTIDASPHPYTVQSKSWHSDYEIDAFEGCRRQILALLQNGDMV